MEIAISGKRSLIPENLAFLNISFEVLIQSKVLYKASRIDPTSMRFPSNSDAKTLSQWIKAPAKGTSPPFKFYILILL